MIEPLADVQDVVSLLDVVVANRPHLPPLVVVTTSEEGNDARGFVDGYRDRLTDVEHRSLVPHAHAGEAVFGMAREHDLPDVDLLDQLANQFRSTVPAGAGRHWRTHQFTTCLDVVEAAEHIDVVGAQQTRVLMRTHLEDRWATRRPLLSWIKRTAESAEFPTKLVGLLLGALVAVPSRWWFARTLDGRRFRWFGSRVNKANGLHGDFLDQAAWLLPSGGLPDVTSLRRRILFEALLRDLESLTRRGGVVPWRRRRRWTPVLLLDATDPLAATLVDLYAELTRDWPVAPLLVIAAMTAADGEATAGEPLPAAKTVPLLRSHVNGGALPSPPWLTLRLGAGPRDLRVVNWLKSHLRVAPRVPGAVSAFAPLAVVVLLVASVAGFGTYAYLTDDCSDTRLNALGERVGVLAGDCGFGVETTASGAPFLGDLEKRVATNNAMVDRLDELNPRTGEREPRYHREIVFFGPLTRPGAIPGTSAPANALWQLEAAIAAQAEHNGNAERDLALVPIKLALANSGDKFTDGAWVAEKIMERPKNGSGALAAVIGISQSRDVSYEAVTTGLRDVPVVGASMYGSGMVNGKNMFLSAPTNPAFADKMAEWVRGSEYARSAVVYDPDDGYFSRELHDKLAGHGIGDTELDIRITEDGPSRVSDNRLKSLCEQAARKEVLPVLAGRADQIVTLLQAANRLPECASKGARITMLAGPGLIVTAATGKVADFGWLDLRITCLAETPAESDRTTGRDAFGFAAKAVAEANRTAGADLVPKLVLSVLEQEGFELNRPNGSIKLNRADSANRVQVVDVS